MEENVSRGEPAGPILVVGFGAQYAQLIAQRVRETRIYSEIVLYLMPADQILAKRLAVIILSGGPSPVYIPDAPRFDTAIFNANMPVLGICCDSQVMAQAPGGVVTATGTPKYGYTNLPVSYPGTLSARIPAEQTVWTSHDDVAAAVLSGFQATASTKETRIVVFENPKRHLYGVRPHPEVRHTTRGQRLLEQLLYVGTGLEPMWIAKSIIDTQVALIYEQVGNAQVIYGLNGGVDSLVVTVLTHRAVGDQLTYIFIGHGLLREGEKGQVEHGYAAGVGIRVKYMGESVRFLTVLKGVTESEQERKTIGHEFIRPSEAAQRVVIAEAGAADKEIKFLVQGTLYPDITESGGGSGTVNIKLYHNMGGLPEDLKLGLIEPLCQLFKGEV